MLINRDKEKQAAFVPSYAQRILDPASVNDRKTRVRSVGKNRCVETVRPIRNL